MNKSATSKEVLLERAREIAYHEGVSRLSIRRLAAEMGIAVGTVYNYYPSKADLVADVMEDFWRNVFHGSHFDTESSDFLESVREIYRRLSVSLAVFEKEFLEDLSAMERAEKEKSRMVEQRYIEHMKAGVLKILCRDPRIDPTVWTDDFTPEALVEFTFSNITLSLTEGQADCEYLCTVLERLLYQS